MKAFLLILSISLGLQAWSQQEYFVFLQTENHQPFYIRLGERNFSSSASGYLILSKLHDSSYSFVVGFAQSQFPEQPFTIIINKKDRGFEIKNLGTQGWALFDLQTLQLINSTKSAGTGSGGASYNLIKKDDEFARLMAGVVNDTAVMYTVVVSAPPKDVVTTGVVKDEKKADPVKTDTADRLLEPKKEIIAKTDTVAQFTQAKKEEPKKEVSAKADTAAKLTEPKKEAIVKTDTSTKLLEPKKEVIAKADTAAKLTEPKKEAIVKTDTSTKLLEPKKEVIAKTDTLSKLPEKQSIQDSVFNPPALPVIYVANQYKSDSGYHITYVDDTKDSIHIFIPEEKEPKVKTDIVLIKKDTVVSAPPAPPVKETAVDSPKTKLVMMNSDCHSFATPGDVDKLRVKLINEKDSDARIASAKKAFKSKCYSAQQIKGLSELFPYDEQKYKFFEAAYPFVSDTGNFKLLVSLFTDPDYAQRFRKLVRLD